MSHKITWVRNLSNQRGSTVPRDACRKARQAGEYTFVLHTHQPPAKKAITLKPDHRHNTYRTSGPVQGVMRNSSRTGSYAHP